MSPILRILFINIFVFSTHAFAGSWTLPKNAKQHIVTYRYYSADEFYTAQGKRRDKNGTFRKHEIEHYFEAGLTDTLTLGWSLALSHENDRQNNNDFNPLTNQTVSVSREITLEGVSRIEPFARFQLYRDNHYALAIQPSVKFPSLYANELPAEAQPDEWEGELALQGGRSFIWLNHSHYIDTSLGYRYRDGELGNQYRAIATFGSYLTPKFGTLLQLQHIEAIGAIDANFATLSGSNNFDLTKLQISGLYEILPNIALQLGGSADIDGVNTGRGTSVFSGLWFTF